MDSVKRTDNMHYPLNKYPHELTPEGDRCRKDCPACRYAAEQKKAGSK